MIIILQTLSKTVSRSCVNCCWFRVSCIIVRVSFQTFVKATTT